MLPSGIIGIKREKREKESDRESWNFE